MVKFDKFYREYGTRYINFGKAPLFNIYSIDNVTNLSIIFGGVNYIERPFYKFLDKFQKVYLRVDDSLVKPGEYQKYFRKDLLNSILKDMKRDYRKQKLYTVSDKELVKVRANHLILIQDISSSCYKVSNSYKELIENRIAVNSLLDQVDYSISVLNRDTIVVVDVPNLTYEEIIENLRSKASETSKEYLFNYNNFIFYEFIKLILEDYKNETLFNRFKNKNYEKINFYLRNGERGYLLNLKFILSALGRVEADDIFSSSYINDKKLLKLILHNNNLAGLREHSQVVKIKQYINLTQADEDTVSADISDTELIVKTENKVIKKEKVELAENLTPTNYLLNLIESKVEIGELTAIKAEELKNDLKDLEVKIPEPEELKIEKKRKPVVTKIDENLAEDTIDDISREYVEKHYKRDIVDMIKHVALANVIPKDIEVNEKKSVAGDYLEVNFKLKPLKGPATTQTIILPKIEKDGTYKTAGNTYRLKPQRVDIPIKKINENTVLISSYNGKYNIYRGRVSNNRKSYQLFKKLFEISRDKNDKRVEKLVAGKIKVYDTKLPTVYELLIESILEFYHNGYHFTFNYHERDVKLKEGDNLKDIEKHGILIGRRGDVYKLINFDNKLVTFDSKKQEVKIGNDFLEEIGIDYHSLGDELVEISILKNHIPLTLIVSSWIGFENMLEKYELKYEKIEPNKRVDRSQYYVVKFSDSQIIVPKSRKAELVLSGFEKYNNISKHFTLNDYNSENAYNDIFNVMDISINVINMIKDMFTLFLDPVTKSVLRSLKLPDNMVDISVKVIELLMDNRHLHNNDRRGMYIRGYERVPGLLYSVLSKSITQHNYKTIFTKNKLKLNPYEIMNLLNSDSSEIVDDINPIGYLKQKAETTALGIGGRTQESMTTPSRIYHPSQVGVISEATKDSQMVAISAGLTFNPEINNVRGIMDDFDNGNLSPYKVYSVSALRAPFMEHDDPKRVGFISIQMTHEAPLVSGEALPLRTGIEEAVPYRLGEKFVTYAEMDGVVENVTDKYVSVKYKDGSKKKYKLFTWTSKEAAGLTYSHDVVTFLKKGDKLKEGDTITYDNKFFVRDMFNPNRVILTWGKIYRIALLEKLETWEDSLALRSSLADDFSVEATKVYSEILNITDRVELNVNLKEDVKAGDVLLTKLGEEVDKSGIKLDKQAIKTLSMLAKTSVKSSLSGKLIKIKAFYNCDESELSPSIKKILNLIDEEDKGQVTSGYSVSGRKLLPGEIELKFYFKSILPIGVVDKVVLASQAKCTLGDPYDYEIYDENGNLIDGLFSTDSLEARNVTSAFLQGAYMNGLDVIRKKIIEAYDN